MGFGSRAWSACVQRAVFVVSLVLLGVSGAAAEKQHLKPGEYFPPDSLAAAFIKSDHMRQRVVQSAIVKDAELRFYCAGDYQVELGLAVVTDLEFVIEEGEDYPKQGIWKQTFGVDRCGKKSLYNTIFIKLPGRELNMLLWMPGLTQVNPRLFTEFVEELFDAARLAAELPDCRDTRVIDTYSDAYDPDKKRQNNTTVILSVEQWILNTCGRKVHLAVGFMQLKGRSGVTFYVQPPDEASKLWRKPSEQVSPVAQPDNEAVIAAYELLEKGADAEKDGFLRQAAINGHRIAQYLVGSLIFEREASISPAKIREAIYWMLRSAYNDYPPAQHMVGYFYESGTWLPRDAFQAERWYELAAKAGIEEAATALRSLEDDETSKDEPPQPTVSDTSKTEERNASEGHGTSP